MHHIEFLEKLSKQTSRIKVQMHKFIPIGNNNMAQSTHIEAAKLHEDAAKAHHTAAELHGKSDGMAALESSKKARGLSEKANTHSMQAHQAPGHHAK